MPELPELNRLVADNEARLMRYVGRYLREPQDARDAVQEAFIRLSRERRKIDNAEAWLFRVARNLCLDFLKSKRLKVEVSLEEGMDNACESSGSPDAQATTKDDLKLLGRLVEGLSSAEREIICLKLEHEKSYKEIAEITGASISNVGFILHNAMKKMRNAYRELEHGLQ